MYAFGEIDKTSTIIKNNVVNYSQNLNTSSLGIQSIKIVSGSINTNYWNSLNVLFYTSGSPVYSNGSESIFSNKSSNISIVQSVGEQFLTKYHGYPSSSLITIPNQYFGERIREGSFEFIEVNVSDNNGINPRIIDDGNGNLYSTTAHHSQSTSANSSSDNYVGNIFYQHGLIVITETGSWSGSVNYSDLGTNFTLNFDSYNTINTHEYNINIKPNEFNHTMNYTIRNVLSGSTEPLTLETPYIASPFTGSEFRPYITTINLYQDGDFDTPVIQATLPRPVLKSDKINTRFKIKLDL
tara:strand:- start:449 stop:1339 length:891 start_codon:yes stop_codon:yes gene_type:complete